MVAESLFGTLKLKKQKINRVDLLYTKLKEFTEDFYRKIFKRNNLRYKSDLSLEKRFRLKPTKMMGYVENNGIRLGEYHEDFF